MEIIVCVKQVPDTADVRMDPERNIMIREGIPNTVNPFDLHALEAAVRLKERFGGTVTAVTMGPRGAEDALRTCCAQGADELVLVTDPLFGGSDTYSTAYILANAIRAIGAFDLIFCGKQAIDGDTAQVGPELAEQLGLPQITYACELTVTGGSVQALRELDTCYERVQAPLPALVTVVKSMNEPRCPHFRQIQKAANAVPRCLTAKDLPELDFDRLGVQGSPTKVHRIFKPSYQKQTRMIQEEDPNQAVACLLKHLEQDHIQLGRGLVWKEDI